MWQWDAAEELWRCIFKERQHPPPPPTLDITPNRVLVPRAYRVENIPDLMTGVLWRMMKSGDVAGCCLAFGMGGGGSVLYINV